MKKFTKFCLMLAIFIIAGNWAYAAQVTVTVGTGTNVAYSAPITPFGTNWEDGQNQMLFTVLELNIAGIGAGDITEIGWDVVSTGGAMNGFNIEMKTTSATSATSFESGFINVYSTAYTPVEGWNVFTLTTPFNWDGTSNLLVKVCFDNTSYTSNSTVHYTSGSYADMNAYSYSDGTSGCSDPYQGTTNRPNTRITGEEFTGMLPPGVPTNPSPVDGETSVAITGDLTWDFGSDTDTYDLWYGPAGSMIQVVTGDNAGATGSYSYTADYLITYEWQVIAYNSAKGTTNGPVWTFITKCDVFTAPFSENFDGVTTPALPDCWSKIEITSSGYVQTYANYYYSAPNCVRMRITNQSDKCILITPELSDLTSQLNRITFQGQALTYVQDVIVGTMSDPTDEATFTAYQTITLSKNFYTEYTVNFDANYTLTDKYIAFKDASTYNYRIMTIDDFVYEPMPSCLKPTDLTATNNGITSVDLGWTENNTPPATSWEIEYGDQGFTQGTGTTVIADSNPFHLTGLIIDHDYSFYVRTNCGGGDYSVWTGPFDFSTIDGKATNPDPANNATFVLITAKTFNWDDVIDADNYKIDIGTATGLADIVDGAFCATSDYTYTGADWDYNEDYYWTVTTVYTAKADVTGDEWKFTTECDAVSTFPWTEGFENGGAIPSCWSQEYVNGTHDWVFQDGGSYSHPANAHTGNYNAAFTHDNRGDVTKLVSPALDISGLTDPKLTFWHAQIEWYGDQDELRVYYKTSAAGSWIMIPGAEWTGNITDWTEETFTLPSPSSDYYIAFEGTDDYGYGVVVDDIIVKGTPPGDICQLAIDYGQVDDPAVNDATTYTGDLVWYKVEVPETMDVVFSLCGSEYDTKIAVYGDCGDWDGEFPDDYDLHGAIVYNNDNPVCAQGEYSAQSLTQIQYANSGTYYVLIWGFDGDFGNYLLDIYKQDQVIPALPGWNGLSSYIIPDAKSGLDMDSVFANVKQQLKIIIAENGIYWPGQNINTIGDFNVYEGYKVKWNSLTSLLISGTPVQDKTVSFGPGIHYLPVLSDVPVSLADLLSPLGDDIMFMFDIFNGEIYWPAGGIYTLEWLYPGSAYLFRANNAVTFDFTPLPKNYHHAHTAVTFVNNTGWNDVTRTGDQHIVVLNETALSKLEKGNVVAMFNTNDLCTGMADYNGKPGNLAMVVYGQDPTTKEIDGMIPQEYMKFMVYRDGEIIEMTPVYDRNMPNFDGLFALNGLSIINDLKMGPLSVEEELVSGISISPNPSTGVFNIDLKGIENTLEITVINSHGQLVYKTEINGSQQLDLSSQPNGVYFIRLVNSTMVKIVKIVKR